MKQEKIKNIKEKQLQKKAEANYRDIIQEGYVQNPIKAKFLAFQKTKKDINLKDLF